MPKWCSSIPEVAPPIASKCCGPRYGANGYAISLHILLPTNIQFNAGINTGLQKVFVRAGRSNLRNLRKHHREIAG